METRKTDMKCMYGAIIAIIGLALIVAFPWSSTTNSIVSMPFYDIMFIIIVAIGIFIMVYSIITDILKAMKEQEICR